MRGIVASVLASVVTAGAVSVESPRENISRVDRVPSVTSRKALRQDGTEVRLVRPLCEARTCDANFKTARPGSLWLGEDEVTYVKLADGSVMDRWEYNAAQTMVPEEFIPKQVSDTIKAKQDWADGKTVTMASAVHGVANRPSVASSWSAPLATSYGSGGNATSYGSSGGRSVTYAQPTYATQTVTYAQPVAYQTTYYSSQPRYAYQGQPFMGRGPARRAIVGTTRLAVGAAEGVATICRNGVCRRVNRRRARWGH